MAKKRRREVFLCIVFLKNKRTLIDQLSGFETVFSGANVLRHYQLNVNYPLAHILFFLSFSLHSAVTLVGFCRHIRSNYNRLLLFVDTFSHRVFYLIFDVRSSVKPIVIYCRDRCSYDILVYCLCAYEWMTETLIQ